MQAAERRRWVEHALHVCNQIVDRRETNMFRGLCVVVSLFTSDWYVVRVSFSGRIFCKLFL